MMFELDLGTYGSSIYSYIAQGIGFIATYEIFEILNRLLLCSYNHYTRQ